MNKSGKYNKIVRASAAVIIVLVLVYTTGITQTQKQATYNNAQELQADTTITGEDSVEVVGIPTDDDPWKELEKIVSAYYAKTGIRYKGTIKAIDDNGEKEKVLEENAFEYTMLGKSFHYKLGNIECVQNEKSILLVDHANKTIAWSPGIVYSGNSSDGDRQTNVNKLFDIKAFKKTMLDQKANARVTQTDNEKILTIDKITDPSIQGYRLYYSPQTYRIHKMLIGMARLSPLEGTEEETSEGLDEYYYYLDVDFTAIDVLSLNEKQFKPENRFIKITKGKLEPMPAYSEYKILNNGE